MLLQLQMQLIAYSMLYDKYFDLSNLILTEIGLNLETRNLGQTKFTLLDLL